jgi:hypothetical protein
MPPSLDSHALVIATAISAAALCWRCIAAKVSLATADFDEAFIRLRHAWRRDSNPKRRMSGSLSGRAANSARPLLMVGTALSQGSGLVWTTSSRSHTGIGFGGTK